MKKIITLSLLSISCLHSAPKYEQRRNELEQLKLDFVEHFLTATNDTVATHCANLSVGNHPFLIAFNGGATPAAATPAQILLTKTTAADKFLETARRLQACRVYTITIGQDYRPGYFEHNIEAEVRRLDSSINIQDAVAIALAVKIQQNL